MIGVAAAQQWQASVVAVLALLVAALIRGRWPRAAAAIVLLAPAILAQWRAMARLRPPQDLRLLPPVPAAIAAKQGALPA